MHEVHSICPIYTTKIKYIDIINTIAQKIYIHHQYSIAIHLLVYN